MYIYYNDYKKFELLKELLKSAYKFSHHKNHKQPSMIYKEIKVNFCL